MGYIYMMKLGHLVADKIHARAVWTLFTRHPATAGRQGAIRRPALRRNGSVGDGSLRRCLHVAGTPDREV
ncbi:MAG: hypothetical protein WDM76_15415 [Limisphaerales bacterium]